MKLFLLTLPVLLGLTLVGEQPAGDPFRDVAERYVRLVLAVGQHDGDYVDAMSRWQRLPFRRRPPVSLRVR